MEANVRDLWGAWRRHRSEEAFAALVKAQVPYVYDFARRIGCPPADADDAVQEALVLLAGEESGDPVRVGVRAWLARRVSLRTRNAVRARARRRRRERASARPERTGDTTDRVGVREEVAAALDHLDDAERQAVVLRYLHDLDYREIAYVLGLSEGACRLRVHRGVQRLRGALGGHATAMVGALGLFASPAPALLATKAVAATGGLLTTGGVLLMSTTLKICIAALVGAALTALGIFAAGATEPETPNRAARAREEASSVEPAAGSRPRPATAAPAPAERFAAGTAILRIGDHYRFGDDALVDGDADLHCLDIRDGALLATRHGSGEARLPILPSRDAIPPEHSYPRVADAPETLDGTRLELPREGRVEKSGVGLVRTASGTVYKVVATRFEQNDDALQRRVHLAYEPVPVAAGGGAVPHPDGVPLRQPAEGMVASIRRLMTVPPAFAEKLAWVKLHDVSLAGELPPELTIGPTRQIALPGPLVTKLTVTGPGTYSSLNPIGPALVYAPQGIAAEAKLNGRSWSVFLVEGDLFGEVETNTFAYVRITGSVEGKLVYRSLGFGVVDGDIRGTLELKSSATVLVRGVVPDPASIRCRSSATLYLQQLVSRDFIEKSGGSRSGTLHIQSSDLAPGTHEKVGGWGTVVVADPIWTDLVHQR